MVSIYDLPVETIARITLAASSCQDRQVPEHEQDRFRTNTLKQLSEVNHTFRQTTLSLLWRTVSIPISFERLSDSIRCLESLSRSGHPVGRYGKLLAIHIEDCHITLSHVLLNALDNQLARCVQTMPNLENVRICMKSAHDWPETSQAVMSLPRLNTLDAAARGKLRIPTDSANAIHKLVLRSDVGSCALNIASFGSMQELSLAMEDNPTCQSWDELHFPTDMWSNLKNISMRGFLIDPLALLGRMADSLHRCKGQISLRSFSYHLARDEQDATLALQVLGRLPLTSLSFTVPFLFDAQYARAIVRTFPQLRKLELFAFSRAAAWQWPNAFEDYIAAFTELKHLRYLVMNHNELETPSFPPTLPEALPADVLPAGEVSDIPLPHLTEEGSQEEAIVNNSADQQEGPLIPDGPLGANFCPDVSSLQLIRQQEIVDDLARLLPDLREVTFEPPHEDDEGVLKMYSYCVVPKQGAESPVEEDELRFDEPSLIW